MMRMLELQLRVLWHTCRDSTYYCGPASRDGINTERQLDTIQSYNVDSFFNGAQWRHQKTAAACRLRPPAGLEVLAGIGAEETQLSNSTGSNIHTKLAA
jgi:hypothetical protein